MLKKCVTHFLSIACLSRIFAFERCWSNLEKRAGKGLTTCGGSGSMRCVKRTACMSRRTGGNSEEGTPVPIPNTVVKLLSPDGTARASVWESRTSPGLFYKARSSERALSFKEGTDPEACPTYTRWRIECKSRNPRRTRDTRRRPARRH